MQQQQNLPDHLKQKPPKPHIILSYMIFDTDIYLKQTGDKTFTLNFNYQSETDLLISVFTFAQEMFNIETYTTEGLSADKLKGSEHHVNLSPSPEPKQAKVEKVKVLLDEKYNFTEKFLNNFYPMMIRIVRCVYK